MSNEFNSQDNEKVINIAENRGDIIMGGKETADKNNVEIKNEGISNSTVTNHFYQNKPQENTPQTNNHQPLFIIAGLVVCAIAIVAIIALSKQSTEATITNSPVNSNTNSIVSSQPSNIPTNMNVIANQAIAKPNIERPTPMPNKIGKSKDVTQPKAAATAKKVIVVKSEVKPKPNATPSDCSSTTDGC